MGNARKGDFARKTKETDIRLSLNLDGKGKYKVDSGIPFFDHMLEQFLRHSHFDAVLKAKGDTEVDLHHLIEDVGIVIGGALKESSGDKKGIRRFGFASVPMDEALVQTSVDFCGRDFFVYNNKGIYNQAISECGEGSRRKADAAIAALKKNGGKKGEISGKLLNAFIGETMAEKFFYDYVRIFFDALSKNALMTLHINVIYGSNMHHIVEAAFKSAGIAAANALKVDGDYGIPSTKGSI